MKFALLAIILISTATQATALSCSAPNPIRATQHAVQSTDRFIMAYGQLQEMEPRPQTLDGSDFAPGPVSYRAGFVGMTATRRGFDTPIDTVVDVTDSCASVWCGRAAMDTQMLVFLKQEGASLRLIVGPCDSGGGFPGLDRSDLRKVLDCAFKGVCRPEEYDHR